MSTSLRKFLGRSREFCRSNLGIVLSGVTFRGRSVRELDVYYPNSYNYWRFPELTYQSANRLPDLLLKLIDSARESEPTKIEILNDLTSDADCAQKLGDLFALRGSDKATHGYHEVYGPLFDILLEKSGPVNVLEIGLGTTDLKAVSTMGAGGKPGASLRAFRDLNPKVQVFGADIDRAILFSEEGITCGWLDQTSADTFLDFHEQIGSPVFDLVIDDGLHSPQANLETLIWSLGVVRPEGFVVIEDIPRRSTSVWHLVSRILALSGTKSVLHECRTSSVFVVHV